MTYQPKVYRKQGGDELVVASGGIITVEAGGGFAIAGDRGRGYIPIGILNARLLTTNAFLNTIEAGTPDGNTAPSLQRVNAATDKKARLAWAAAAVDEIHLGDFAYPPDLDDAQPVTVHVLAAMAGATDIPVLAIGYFEGVGDTNAGGNTAAVTGTPVGEYFVTIAAADVGAHPNAASITLTPAAHGTDILYVYAAWVEYVRKTS